MPRIWSFESNSHENWNMESITMERGKLNIDDWYNEVYRYPWVKSYNVPEIDILEGNVQSGNTVSTLNQVTKCLNYNESQHINTVDIYDHPDYTIKAMYINDYDYGNCDNMNYCATIINTEKLQIYETVVFMKFKDNVTVDLSLKEILYLFISFYYVRGIKLNNGVFEDIFVNNYEPELERMFASYDRKLIGNWVVMSERKSMLDKVKNSGNDINQLSGIIWFKMKTYTGDVSVFHELNVEHNKSSDFRGLYENIDEQYVLNMFFM